MQVIPSLKKRLTCATANHILTASVRFAPIKFWVNLSIERSTCFLRRHTCEYFIFFRLHGSNGSQFGWMAGSQMVQCRCLDFFFELPNSKSGMPLPIMSFFISILDVAGLTGTVSI